MPIVDIDGIGKVELPDDASLRHKLRYFELAGQLNKAQQLAEQQSSFNVADVQLPSDVLARSLGAGAQAGGQELIRGLGAAFPGQTAGLGERFAQLGTAAMSLPSALWAAGGAALAEPFRGDPLFEQRPTIAGREVGSPAELIRAGGGMAAATMAPAPFGFAGMRRPLPGTAAFAADVPPLGPTGRLQALAGQQAAVRDQLRARMAAIRDAQRTTSFEPPQLVPPPQPPGIPHMEARPQALIVPTAEQIAFARTGGGTPFQAPPALFGPGGQLLGQSPMRTRTPSPILDPTRRGPQGEALPFRQIEPADAVAHTAPIEGELLTSVEQQFLVRPPEFTPPVKAGPGALEQPLAISAKRLPGVTPLVSGATGEGVPLRIGGFPAEAPTLPTAVSAVPRTAAKKALPTQPTIEDVLATSPPGGGTSALIKLTGKPLPPRGELPPEIVRELERYGEAVPPGAGVPPEPPVDMAEWLRSINTGIFRPAAGTVLPDEVGAISPVLAARLGSAGIGAAAGGATGETTEERIKRAAGGALAGFTAGVVGTRAARAYQTAKQIHAPKAPLPAALTSAISDAVYGATSTRVSAAGGGVPMRPRTALDVLHAIHKDASLIDDIGVAMDAHGYSLADLGQLFLEQNVDPRRVLMRGTAVAKRMEALSARDPNARELLRGIASLRADIGMADEASYYGLKASGAIKGVLVTALETAFRNTIIQKTYALAIEPLVLTVEGAIRAAAGATERASPLMGLRWVMDYASSAPGSKAWRQMDEFLNMHPRQRTRLFMIYSGDVADRLAELGPAFARSRTGQWHPLSPRSAAVNSLFSDAELTIKATNAINRAFEFGDRRMTTYARLMQNLRHLGVRSLDDVFAGGRVSPDQLAPALEDAIDTGLRITLAGSPKGGYSKAIMDSIAGSATLQLGLGFGAEMWFPRYLYNAMKFLWDYPVGGATSAFRTLWRAALTPGQRAAIIAGDARSVGEAATGFALILAGAQLAYSEYAGSKVTTVKLQGKEYDVTPFGPIIGPYYVAARAVRAQQEGNLSVHARDLANYTINWRNGPQMAVIEKMIEAAGEADVPEVPSKSMWAPYDKPTRGIRESTGRFAANFLQPATSLQNLFAMYLGYIPGFEAIAEAESKKRETRQEPFWGPIKQRIPVVIGETFAIPHAGTLPEKELPLRGEAPKRDEPLTVGDFPLFTALKGQRFNPPEREAIRLGMKPHELAGRGTGEPLADILLRRHLGPQAERIMTQVVAAPGYQMLNDPQKAVVFDLVMKELRQATRDLIRDRIAQQQDAGAPLTPEETATVEVRIHDLFGPRIRKLLRHQGVDIPR